MRQDTPSYGDGTNGGQFVKGGLKVVATLPDGVKFIDAKVCGGAVVIATTEGAYVLTPDLKLSKINLTEGESCTN